MWRYVGSLLEDNTEVCDDVTDVTATAVTGAHMGDVQVDPGASLGDVQADTAPRLDVVHATSDSVATSDTVAGLLMMSDTSVVSSVNDTSSAVPTSSVNASVSDQMSGSYDGTARSLMAEYSTTVQQSSTAGAAPRFLPAADQNSEDYHPPHMNLPTSETDAVYQSASVAADAVRPFYQQDSRQSSSPQQLSTGLSAGKVSAAGQGFPYTADGLAGPGPYPLLPVRSDGPLQSLEGLAADGSSYMGAGVISSSYVELPQSSLIDSSASYSMTMSLPPYPATEVTRIPSYLPYAAARTAVETPRTMQSPTIYGRSVPAVAPAFPSDAFTKEFLGQYLHETSSGPLHPLATHGSLHDQHAAAAAGILGGYQQASTLPTMPHSTLPTMPHGGNGSELFRRAYSGVSDNLFGGMKSPAQSTLGAAQSQHWMAPAVAADPPRRWNHTPPSVHPDVSRYAYPPGRTELADTAKSLPPAPAPMSKRPDDMTIMFAATSSASSSVHYPLSGGVYSPPTPGPPPYPHPSLPSAVNPSHRQLEDAYRQMAAGDYRSLAHHRTPSEMYGSALSSLDRYYYTARDAMYRSQQLAAAAMPHPFIPQTSIASQYSDRAGGAGYVRDYGQCHTPAYGFMCPPGTDKQYLPPSSMPVRAGDYLESSASQDAYSRHSVIYNMMPRYF